MLYSALITQLRNQVGDTKRRIHVDFTGDGSTTVFQLPTDTYPVYDGSGTSAHMLKVAGVTQTETTNYTLDKDSGTIVFVTSAPTNGQAITFDAIAVYLTDADWLAIINNVIKSLGDDFWKEFIDTAHTATANMLSLSLVALQPNCIAVYEFQRRTNTSTNWIPVEEDCNWRYDRDNNVLYIGIRDAFTLTGELIRIRGLKTYTLGTAVTDTVDVQDKFLTIIEYGCIARYWRWRYKSVVELVSKLSTESSRTPLQELIMLSDRFDRLYEIEKGKLKPTKPAHIIPPFKNGGGRP
jgi:hypothetical protein